MKLQPQPEAMFRKIAAEIREKIYKGTLKPGQIIESQKDLARRKRVSPCTAQRAFALLEEEGFVKSYQHHGTFVTGAEPPFPMPPYMRVVNDIARDIGSGLLKPCDMLLTRVELGELYVLPPGVDQPSLWCAANERPRARRTGHRHVRH